MPELPEVETDRRGLAPLMEGRRIIAADIRRPDLRWPLPQRMAERLTGARVEMLERRSKYLLARLDRGETLLVHLGMSGRWLVTGDILGSFHHALPAPAKHDHVILDLEGGARLTFNDARRFGAMTTATTGTNTAAVILDGAIKSGTNVAALTTGNLLTVNNYGASRVIVKFNGDIYSDSTAGVLLFDEHDDAALLRALSYELNPAAVIRNRFDDFVAYNRADLEAGGIVEGTMVNQTALARLLTGAIWQLHSRIAELEARLERAA